MIIKESFVGEITIEFKCGCLTVLKYSRTIHNKSEVIGYSISLVKLEKCDIHKDFQEKMLDVDSLFEYVHTYAQQTHGPVTNDIYSFLDLWDIYHIDKSPEDFLKSCK